MNRRNDGVVRLWNVLLYGLIDVKKFHLESQLYLAPIAFYPNSIFLIINVKRAGKDGANGRWRNMTKARAELEGSRRIGWDGQDFRRNSVTWKDQH